MCGFVSLHGRDGDGCVSARVRRGRRCKLPLRYFLFFLVISLIAGCATVEEQVQPIPLDRVPSTVPSPSAADAAVPPGYRAEVVVSLLNYPSSLTFDPVGNLYIAESGAPPGDESRPPR